MRRIQWLLGVSLATAAAIVACGDSTTDTPPAADAGQDTSVVDSSKPDTGVVDSGLPDVVEDSATCTSDADLNTLNPADAALGEAGSVGTCVACGKTNCATELTACQGDCTCTNTLACFYDCIGQPGGSLLGCGQQCGADIQTPGPTQDVILCIACGCTTECNVPAQIAKAVCGSKPADGGTDSAPADAAADAPADAPADALADALADEAADDRSDAVTGEPAGEPAVGAAIEAAVEEGRPDRRPDDRGEDDPGDQGEDGADPRSAAPSGGSGYRTRMGTTIALRGGRRGLRARVDHGGAAAVLGSAALQPDGLGPDDGTVRRLPEEEELRRGPQPFDDGRVRPLSRLGDPVAPLVVEDFVPEPAYDPVIGPELAAARTRVGLSVDELAERTRIRPHVIESIEVDDFAPCGGDFYARGHLRTLARMLGRDPGPLLEQFDRRYATAPVSARTVFEAELATGMTGSMRSTAGGASWPLLVGVVLALVLIWGVVRLFAAEPPETLQSPVPVLHGAQGGARLHPGTGSTAAAGSTALEGAPVRLTVSAAHAASRVVVRDGTGKVVWAGDLAMGATHTLRAVPPVRVRAADAGAVEVSVAGRDEGTLGALGRPGRRTFQRSVR
jgi:hypothetical protein